MSERKASGATYTPRALADYLAERLIESAPGVLAQATIRVLDPALGDGALALALLGALGRATTARVQLVGYEIDARAAARARRSLRAAFGQARIEVRERDFLADGDGEQHDLAIANPPYVRTQILGAGGAARLAARFGLEGRVDLYQAFALAIVERLRPGGGLALVTSNRFLTTRGAAAFRDALGAQVAIARLWDLGDTRVFDAAVLPAMLVGHRRTGPTDAAREPRFTSVYEQPGVTGAPCAGLTDALDRQGDFAVGERSFRVEQGQLRAPRGEVWRLSSASVDGWLHTVGEHTWRRLGQVGKIRVGVKSTADRVFIRRDWAAMGEATPELLRPLLTHHVAGRYRAGDPVTGILYPHRDRDGRREVIDLADYPRTAAYLASHRTTLEGRTYVREAGRRWYELWVPQEPALWSRPKLVFRDIAEQPTFWVDTSGAVVNGDCYWMVVDGDASDDLLWLAAAVANSTFIETFYDRSFPNKLYAGRRRFMSQYVEQFPLPAPDTRAARSLVALARRRYGASLPGEQARLERQIDERVWAAFGVEPARAGGPGVSVRAAGAPAGE